MLQSEVFPKYREYSDYLEKAYRYLQSLYIDKLDEQVEELCIMRGYPDEEHHKLFKEMKIGYCSVFDIEDLGDLREKVGLVTKEDGFILNNRFIIPVLDIDNRLSTLIGYYPDFKKYITVSTPFFSKNNMFLNFRQAYDLAWSKFNGVVILVEGVFDCLSLRSIGLPAIATMGSTVDAEKGELLKLFRKVIAIPDGDKVGHQALNRYAKKGWKVPSNTIMIKFIGCTLDLNGTKVKIKDMDDFVKLYEAEDVINTLLAFADSKEEIETLKL